MSALTANNRWPGLDRRRLAAGIRVDHLRPGRIIAYSWLLALVPIAALQLVHADLHEAHELPPSLHWLRDGAMAVPPAALAVALATLWVARGRREPASFGTHIRWALMAVAIFAVLSIPGNQVHSLLFGAEEEVGADPILDALLDGMYALQVAAVLMVPLTLALGVPWRHDAAPAPAIGDPSISEFPA